MYKRLAGIYSIVCGLSGWHYVGSTNNLARRAEQHFMALEIGRHHNKHLQSSYNRVGDQDFFFVILEECEEELLLEREKVWMSRFEGRLYNIDKTPSRPIRLEDIPVAPEW